MNVRAQANLFELRVADQDARPQIAAFHDLAEFITGGQVFAGLLFHLWRFHNTVKQRPDYKRLQFSLRHRQLRVEPRALPHGHGGVIQVRTALGIADLAVGERELLRE